MNRRSLLKCLSTGAIATCIPGCIDTEYVGVEAKRDSTISNALWEAGHTVIVAPRDLTMNGQRTRKSWVLSVDGTTENQATRKFWFFVVDDKEIGGPIDEVVVEKSQIIRAYFVFP